MDQSKHVYGESGVFHGNSEGGIELFCTPFKMWAALCERHASLSSKL